MKLWGIIAAVPALVLGLTQIGCSASKYRTVDLSDDPTMQGGYRVGQVYRLRAAVQIIRRAAGKPAERLELLSPADVKAFGTADPSETGFASPLAEVPPGAIIQIEKLTCSFTDEYTWSPRNVLVDAFGTLTWPGHSWKNVAAPLKFLVPRLASKDWYNGGLRTASCDLYPPDLALVELVGAGP